MKVVTLFDTAVASTNLGDQIIMDAVIDQLSDLCSNAFIYSVASHDWMGAKSRSLVKRANLSITGGTNLLSSRMWFKPLWKLTPLDALRGLDVTLMGAGWYQFQSKPDLYTRFLLQRVLSSKTLHSVRDGYTEAMLKAAGVNNVINTGCPTLWRLDSAHCSKIPTHKSENVITTLNTYIKQPDLDQQLLELLHRQYRKVYFWVQTQADYEYSKQLHPELIYIDPSVRALNSLYQADISLDYVGNRLHAGIRAIQNLRRTIILEIDNRAKEMGRDFGLPTVERSDFDQLTQMINDPFETKLTLPIDAINQWKSQI